MEKLTYVQALTDVIEGKELTQAHFDKLIALKASYENKANNRSSKPSAKQIENEKIKANILAVLVGADKPMTATEVANAVGVSLNKASALLRMLKEEGKVDKNPVKRISYFSAM